MDMDSAMQRLSVREKTIIILASLGVAFMAYLVALHYQTSVSSLCNFGAGFSCQIVNQSLYSEMLGIPVSLLGIIYFLSVIAAITLRMRRAFEGILLFTVASLVFSAYLTFIEARMLATFCVFCEASKVLMLAIFGLAHGHARSVGVRVPASRFVWALVAGAAFTGVAALLQR